MTTVSVAGEIDLANRAELAETLTSAAADPDLRLLVCDLSRVTFLACTGVSALVELKSAVDASGAELRLVAAGPTVLRVLRATGQHDALGVRSTLAAALDGYVDAAPVEAPTLARLRTSLDEVVTQTTSLAELCDRLADQVAVVDPDRLTDDRGTLGTGDVLAGIAEDLCALRDHLTTGTLVVAPAVDDLSHLPEST